MIGYHYTSWENWEKIQKEGLVPYKIIHPGLIHPLIPSPLMGVFAWIENPTGFSHVGNLVFQMSTKRSTRIVKLWFHYDKSQTAKTTEGGEIQMSHNGYMNGCLVDKEGDDHATGKSIKYHSAEQGVIVSSRIALENITLMGDYDLIKLLK